MDVSVDFALSLDRNDTLSHLRNKFNLIKDGDVVYMCGNSLGLQPKCARDKISHELNEWAEKGVEGHMTEDGGWYRYHERFRKPFSKLLGCKESEIVVMNSLTVNLHLLMTSFYQPTQTRNKIIIGSCTFPSDNYAVASQAKLRGFDPKSVVVRLGDEKGILSEEQIESYLKKHGDEVALLWLEAVNFRTGYVLDVKSVTELGHRYGVVVGFDLAHAAGNIILDLHNWNVDFAVFCTYKYLNSGPGSPGGAFVHEKHAIDTKRFRFAGWWGNDPNTRFDMIDEFIPVPTADSWSLSNTPIMGMACLDASLSVFGETEMKQLRDKSVKLWEYLVNLVEAENILGIELITPKDPSKHGCQASFRLLGGDERLDQVCSRLAELNVLVDMRKPNIIRISPAPLYNSYLDVWRTVKSLKIAVSNASITPSMIINPFPQSKNKDSNSEKISPFGKSNFFSIVAFTVILGFVVGSISGKK
eukprot:c7932_g1_i1.p1 GENE.c7932_g1_i1~~c7932_g1_i1.p1  ORF type:complete len:473 (-),score=201.64 c7932_g1_i1:24-1442(-)